MKSGTKAREAMAVMLRTFEISTNTIRDAPLVSPILALAVTLLGAGGAIAAETATREPRDSATASASTVAGAVAQQHGRGGASAWLDLEILAGYDSNALELHDGGIGGAFTDLSFQGGLEAPTNGRVSYFLTGYGGTRRHGSESSDADNSWGGLETGVAFTPFKRGLHRLDIAVGGFASIQRSTYIDPATGEAFRIEVDPSTVVSIPERFDFDSRGIFMDLDWRVARGVLVYAKTSLEKRGYVEDYREAGLASLDDESLRIRPGVRFVAGTGVAIDVSGEWTRRDYGSLPALDPSGAEVPGSTRSDRYTNYQIAIIVDATPGMDLSFGTVRTGREDPWAGYYDSHGTRAFASMDYEAGVRNRLSTQLSWGRLDYERATVANVSDGPLRQGSALNFSGRLETTVTKRLTLLFEGGTEKVDDKDLFYDYNRTWARTGIRLGF